mgnify:CR=1 FL=1
MDFLKDIDDYTLLVRETIEKVDKNQLNEAMNAIFDAYERGARIYVCGNGGSASTASHMTNDFNKGICYDLEKKFDLVCLTDNIATIMAIANDDSYDKVFVKQIEGKIRKGDLFIGISGSGNSKNVIEAADYCKARGIEVLGISGYKGGKLYEKADYHMHCPIENMQVVEDVHMMFNHMMMSIFGRKLREKENA